MRGWRVYAKPPQSANQRGVRSAGDCRSPNVAAKAAVKSWNFQIPITEDGKVDKSNTPHRSSQVRATKRKSKNNLKASFARKLTLEQHNDSSRKPSSRPLSARTASTRKKVSFKRGALTSRYTREQKQNQQPLSARRPAKSQSILTEAKTTTHSSEAEHNSRIIAKSNDIIPGISLKLNKVPAEILEKKVEAEITPNDREVAKVKTSILNLFHAKEQARALAAAEGAQSARRAASVSSQAVSPTPPTSARTFAGRSNRYMYSSKKNSGMSGSKLKSTGSSETAAAINSARSANDSSRMKTSKWAWVSEPMSARTHKESKRFRSKALSMEVEVSEQLDDIDRHPDSPLDAKRSQRFKVFEKLFRSIIRHDTAYGRLLEKVREAYEIRLDFIESERDKFKQDEDVVAKCTELRFANEELHHENSKLKSDIERLQQELKAALTLTTDVNKTKTISNTDILQPNTQTSGLSNIKENTSKIVQDSPSFRSSPQLQPQPQPQAQTHSRGEAKAKEQMREKDQAIAELKFEIVKLQTAADLAKSKETAALRAVHLLKKKLDLQHELYEASEAASVDQQGRNKKNTNKKERATATRTHTRPEPQEPLEGKKAPSVASKQPKIVISEIRGSGCGESSYAFDQHIQMSPPRNRNRNRNRKPNPSHVGHLEDEPGPAHALHLHEHEHGGETVGKMMSNATNSSSISAAIGTCSVPTTDEAPSNPQSKPQSQSQSQQQSESYSVTDAYSASRNFAVQGSDNDDVCEADVAVAVPDQGQGGGVEGQNDDSNACNAVEFESEFEIAMKQSFERVRKTDIMFNQL